IKLGSMTPETAEDYLCRGFVRGFGNKDQGLADLDRAIAMRDTPMAHAFRAGVEGVNAANEGNLAFAQRALEDAVEAKRSLSGSKFVRFTSLYVHLVAADRYDEAGQSKKKEDALEEAGRDARELEGISAPFYVMARVNYFRHMENSDAALKELAQ